MGIGTPYLDEQSLCLVQELDTLVRRGEAQRQSARMTNAQLKDIFQSKAAAKLGEITYSNSGGRRVESCFRSWEKGVLA